MKIGIQIQRVGYLDGVGGWISAFGAITTMITPEQVMKIINSLKIIKPKIKYLLTGWKFPACGG